MIKKYLAAREYLRRQYGRKYQAFPIDECELVDYFLWANQKNLRLN